MMDEGHFTADQLIAVLQALDEKWSNRIKEADEQARRLRVGDTHRSFYFRGIADGYRLALNDLRELLVTPSVEPVVTPDLTFVPVSREAALAVIERTGLSVLDLQTHKDHTFTAVFPTLQVMPFDERIQRLNAAAPLIVLDYGRLSNSSKTFIDFGFQTPPEG
jgi:hypothetical protein